MLNNQNTFPCEGILSKAILSENFFISTTAKKVDLNLSLIKYPMLIFHENLNMSLDHLGRVLRSKLNPVIKSRLIRYLSIRIMKVILLKEKFARRLNQLLPKKLSLTVLTVLFGVSFSFLYLSSWANVPKNYGMAQLKSHHKNFRTYAFIDLPQDPYIKTLIFLNSALYFLQSACLLGVFTPTPYFKRGLNSATIGSTVALATQIKLSETIVKSKYGPFIQSLQQPKITLPFSALFAFGFYLSSKTTNGRLISNEMFVNELELFNQIRGSILTLPKDVQVNIEIAARRIYEHGLYPVAIENCKNLKVDYLDPNYFKPLFEDDYVDCVHNNFRQYCERTPICEEFANEVISIIKNLVDKKNFEFGGTVNMYRDPNITAISLINLYTWDKNPRKVVNGLKVIADFAEVPSNEQLFNWLRKMKFFIDISNR